GFDPYPISYRSIVSKKGECSNLLVPVCLSATHIAYGSIRMEPVFMVLAQSAAVAASMAVDSKKSVQDIDVSLLKKTLLTDPYADGSVPDILIDNEDKAGILVTGQWGTGKRGGYGPGYLVDSVRSEAVKTVRFTPEITNSGNYEVYTYYPKLE